MNPTVEQIKAYITTRLADLELRRLEATEPTTRLEAACCVCELATLSAWIEVQEARDSPEDMHGGGCEL